MVIDFACMKSSEEDVTPSNFEFVPAISEQILNVHFRNKEKLPNNQDLTWWTDSPFTMDSGLLSCYYLYMRTGEQFHSFRNNASFPKHKIFMLDSGGYELQTQQLNEDPAHVSCIKNLTPQKVLDIQVANADIGFVLDRPPYMKVINPDKTVDWIHDDKFFAASMKFTADNTAFALDNKPKSSPLKIFGVLQGETYEDMMQWYDNMKDFNVDGMALVPTPKSNYTKTLMYICLALEKDFNIPIHFLGISGFNAIALIIYMSQYYKNKITSDSSSYNAGAKVRSYALPGNYRKNIVIGRLEDKRDADNLGNIFIDKKKNSMTIPIKRLPCNCPICSQMTAYQMRKGTNVGSIAVSLHNLYQQKSMFTLLTSLIDHPETYRDFVISQNRNSDIQKMTSYFNLIDEIADGTTTYSEHFSGIADTDVDVADYFT